MQRVRRANGTFDKQPIKECSVDFCEKKSIVRGLCSMHDARLRRHGAIDIVIRKPFVPTPCIEDRCDRNQYCKKLCAMHYARVKRNGDTKKLGQQGRKPRLVSEDNE